MYQRAGFTLLDILIAIIIISILVLVALPQYKHAVLKSRFSGVMPLAKAVADAQEVYYLGSGEYATTQDKLDIVFPTTVERSSLSISQEEKHNFVMASRSDVPNVHYIRYQEHSQNFPREIHCEAKADDEQANWLCEKGLNGVKLESGRSLTEGYTMYILEGSGVGNYSKTYYNTNDLILSDGDSCERKAGSGGRCNNLALTKGASCIAREVDGGCSNSSFDDSTCTVEEKGYSCSDNTFTNGSFCKTSGGFQTCYNNTFENSVCEVEKGSQRHCSSGTFVNSTCKGKGTSTCGDGTFTNSICEAGGASCVRNSFSNKSTCYAKETGGDSGNRACGSGSTYDNSTCYNQSDSMYGCGKATYNNGSECYSNENGGCGGGSAFNSGSKCYGNASGACGSDTYTGGSVCNANVPGSCNNNTYESGSYCAGNHCPSGTPAGDEDGAFAGHCWNGSGEHAAQYCP